MVSIALSGSIDQNSLLLEEPNSLKLTGVWDFSREITKGQHLRFHFTKKSQSIHREFYEHVSFLRDETMNSRTFSKAKKQKKISDKLLDGKDNVSSILPCDNTGNLTDQFNNNDSGDIELPTTHPLFGLWEGSFQTFENQPEAEFIRETFFFHNFVGMSSHLSLKDLPNEPNVSYNVLGITEVNLKTQIDQFKDQNLSSIPIISTSQIQNEITVVYGFGSNSIGRFSIVGAYFLSSGILRCEKKYLLSKGIKRTKKYSWETPVVADANITDVIESRRTRIRVPSLHNIVDTSYFVNSFNTSDSNKTQSTSKKKNNASKKAVLHSNENKIINHSIVMPRSFEDLYHQNDLSISYRSAFIDEDSGDVYEGEWLCNYRQGRGICLFSNGTMYEGQWFRGKEHGRGQLVTSDRQIIYIGDWSDGQMHGQGIYNFSNGDRYSGDWREGVRHGKGEYLCKSGCSYIGEWRDNKRVGKGIFEWMDGSFYDGEWDNDERSGKGALVLSNGLKYDGLWSHNFMDGRGTCTFSNGQVYQGNFKFGLREGRGSIKFAEDAEYEGRFREDRIDGQGTLKILKTVPGLMDDEILIPIQLQADIKRIHMKAGFGNHDKH